jgi:hypothetical protein
MTLLGLFCDSSAAARATVETLLRLILFYAKLLRIGTDAFQRPEDLEKVPGL